MADYKGSLGSQDRILILEKEREQARKKMQDLESQLRAETEKNNVSNLHSKFAANTSSIEEQLKRDTIGLVTLDEFTKRRNELVEEEKKRVEVRPHLLDHFKGLWI